MDLHYLCRELLFFSESVGGVELRNKERAVWMPGPTLLPPPGDSRRLLTDVRSPRETGAPVGRVGPVPAFILF